MGLTIRKVPEVSTMAKILVADDEPSVLQVVSHLFSVRKGHTVYLAHDAAEAIDFVRKHRPQVALLDIMMPSVHGVELLRQIKQIDPDIKAIMITAVDDEDIAREAIEAGAIEYVTKPLDLNYLDAVVTFQLLD